jgi:hypothetical protein
MMVMVRVSYHCGNTKRWARGGGGGYNVGGAVAGGQEGGLLMASPVRGGGDQRRHARKPEAAPRLEAGDGRQVVQAPRKLAALVAGLHIDEGLVQETLAEEGCAADWKGWRRGVGKGTGHKRAVLLFHQG